MYGNLLIEYSHTSYKTNGTHNDQENSIKEAAVHLCSFRSFIGINDDTQYCFK